MKKLISRFLLLLLAIPVLSAATEPGKDNITLVDLGTARQMLEHPSDGQVVIDVRLRERYLDGHLKGAINIPVPELEKNPALLTIPKAAKILVYCDGVRCNRQTKLSPIGKPCWSVDAVLPTKAGRFAKVALSQGYRNVSVMVVGFRGWDLQGNEAFVGNDDLQRLETVKFGPSELKKLNETKPGAVVFVDVRHPDEFSRGHVPGAINIPIESASFDKATAALDKNSRIILYCNWGDRGQQAYLMLKQRGFTKLARALTADLEEAGIVLIRN